MGLCFPSVVTSFSFVSPLLDKNPFSLRLASVVLGASKDVLNHRVSAH